MIDDEKVKKLPIKFKTPPGADEPMLKVVHYEHGACDHKHTWQNGRMKSVSYLIRNGETEVECSGCGTKLDPMFVLRILASEETKWHHNRENYQDAMKRLSERERTKCDHCGKLTRISRR